jgi:cell division protein FtsL
VNNLKYYNDSLAYDFEMFMPKEKKQPRDNIVVMPQKAEKQNKRRRAAAKSLSPTVAVIMCVVFVLSGLCANIALRIKINEINSEINDVKTAVAELDSQETALEVEFQRRISYINLELEATQLGMKKASKDDVTYIRVNDTNMAKDAQGTVLTNK